MKVRDFFSATLPVAAAILVAASTASAVASDRDRKFFDQVQGEWNGPGEIVAGKYKGTRFNCSFKGTTPDGKIGMSLDGGCRVGLFTQKMSATVEHKGRQGYRGTFMDGAEGEGLDVVDGKVGDRRVTFALNRNQLNGAMLASLPDGDTMHVTVSVRVEDQMVPVIGMNLKRVDQRAVGAISNN
jgi:hypothetical protein